MAAALVPWTAGGIENASLLPLISLNHQSKSSNKRKAPQGVHGLPLPLGSISFSTAQEERPEWLGPVIEALKQTVAPVN